MLNWPRFEGEDEFTTRISKLRRGPGGDWSDVLAHGRTEKGHPLFYADKVNQHVISEHESTMRVTMTTVNQMIPEATAETRKLMDQYHDATGKFRSSIRNDITSMKSAADSMQDNVNKMAETYKRTAALLNSQEFLSAIENAERLAAALKAISELQSHSVTFAVLDRKTIPHAT